MKNTRTFVSGLLACGIVLAFAATASAQTIKDGAAKVVRVKGTARYSLGNNVWQPLKVGEVLRPGSVVQTDRESGSYVDLVLSESSVPTSSSAVVGAGAISPVAGGYPTADPAFTRPVAQQNTVRVFENTVLGIDRLTATATGADMVTETQLDLKSGHILGSVKKMAGASRYEVKIPNGVAGIRGTVYHLWADGRLQVAEGTVVLSIVDAAGNVQTRVVNAGYEYNPRTDQIIQMAPSSIDALQTSGQAAMAMGAVYANVINRNPDMVLIPLRTDLTIGRFVSPTEGFIDGEFDTGGE